jgi:putative oxidoreductase
MDQSKLLWAVSGVLRLIVAGVFGVAAILKLQNPGDFAEQIGNYQLFPELSNIVALTLPSIELTAALALLLTPRSWRHASTAILLGLLVVFTTAIARAWALGINLECGCFGSGSTNIGPWPILRNLSLIAALLLTVRVEQLGKRLRLPSVAPIQ